MFLINIRVKIEKTIHYFQQCWKNYDYSEGMLSDMMLCAVVPDGGKDACQVCLAFTSVLH